VIHYQGEMWLNFETPNGRKSIMHSTDEGMHWSHQKDNGGYISDAAGSTRYLDGGPPHQGPVLPMGKVPSLALSLSRSLSLSLSRARACTFPYRPQHQGRFIGMMLSHSGHNALSLSYNVRCFNLAPTLQAPTLHWSCTSKSSARYLRSF
jgi:hypothetical protein